MENLFDKNCHIEPYTKDSMRFDLKFCDILQNSARFYDILPDLVIFCYILQYSCVGAHINPIPVGGGYNNPRLRRLAAI